MTTAAESARSGNPARFTLWTTLLNDHAVKAVAEVGVYRGELAEALLSGCPGIERYYMIDPWRHLDDWNKPANAQDDAFEVFFAETMQRTAAWQGKREVLRGRTLEVIASIPDASLDFAYIDGDHTLRGITTDLISLWPKMRPGGLIGGDDFTPSIWQHKENFEPTLVFPFAVYFAEAHRLRIEAFPHNQFLIHTDSSAFEFLDHTQRYPSTSLREAFLQRHPRASAATAQSEPSAPADPGRSITASVRSALRRRRQH